MRIRSMEVLWDQNVPALRVQVLFPTAPTDSLMTFQVDLSSTDEEAVAAIRSLEDRARTAIRQRTEEWLAQPDD